MDPYTGLPFSKSKYTIKKIKTDEKNLMYYSCFYSIFYSHFRTAVELLCYFTTLEQKGFYIYP